MLKRSVLAFMLLFLLLCGMIGCKQDHSDLKEESLGTMQLQVITPIKKEPVTLSAEVQQAVLNTLEAGNWKEGGAPDWASFRLYYEGVTYSYLMGGSIYDLENHRYMDLPLFENDDFEAMLKPYIGEVELPFEIPHRSEEQMLVCYNENQPIKHPLSAEDKTEVINLLNACGWKEDALDLDTDLRFYVGESRYYYDRSGVVFGGGFHIELDQETTEKINAIFNSHLQDKENAAA